MSFVALGCHVPFQRLPRAQTIETQYNISHNEGGINGSDVALLLSLIRDCRANGSFAAGTSPTQPHPAAGMPTAQPRSPQPCGAEAAQHRGHWQSHQNARRSFARDAAELCTGI